MRIFGVILAGGAGRRMGGADKATLRLAGRSLAAHAVDRLEPQVERLAISANGDPARLSALGLPVLADAQSQGPLSGVLAALDWAAPSGGDGGGDGGSGYAVLSRRSGATVDHGL